jgi:hypothetical protein
MAFKGILMEYQQLIGVGRERGNLVARGALAARSGCRSRDHRATPPRDILPRDGDSLSRGPHQTLDWSRLYQSFKVTEEVCPYCWRPGFRIDRPTGDYCCRCGNNGDGVGFVEDMYRGYLGQTTERSYVALSAVRGLPASILKDHQLAYGNDLKCWLIPYKTTEGKVVTLLRYYPWRNENNKCLLPCLGSYLYGLDRLRSMARRHQAILMVCEGAFDAIALDYHLRSRQCKDSYDVIALHSASSFKPEWCQHLVGYSHRVRSL